MRKLVIACALLVVGHADACLNDTATDRTEREFRSRYGTDLAPDTGIPAVGRVLTLLVVGCAGLVVGAVLVARSRDRRAVEAAAARRARARAG